MTPIPCSATAPAGSEATPAAESAFDAAFDTVHVDAHCIVVLKPSGLLSVPGRGAHLQDCLARRVRARHADALVVHRLDMATSGLMVYARGTECQRRLNASFAQREVTKTYVAVVDGCVVDDAGEIDLPLGADWPDRPKQRVDRCHGKSSLTRFRVLARDFEQRVTRVELQPVTGRAHQLRVHLLALGHPILGDALYAPAAVRAAAKRLLLHATALGFPHPASGVRLSLENVAPF